MTPFGQRSPGTAPAAGPTEAAADDRRHPDPTPGALREMADRNEVRVRMLAQPEDPSVRDHVVHFDKPMLVTYS